MRGSLRAAAALAAGCVAILVTVTACDPDTDEVTPSGPGLGSLETLEKVSAPDVEDLAAVGLPDVTAEPVEMPETSPTDPCDPTAATPLAGVGEWEHAHSASLESADESTQKVSYGVQVWRFSDADGPRDVLEALRAAADACPVTEIGGVTVTPVRPPTAGVQQVVTGWDLAVAGVSTSRRTAYAVVERSLVEVTLGYRTDRPLVPDDAASQLAGRVSMRMVPVERALVEEERDVQDA